MFARTVTIDGREIVVMCCPDTPLWEVLERAARQLRNSEEKATVQGFFDALEAYRDQIKAYTK